MSRLFLFISMFSLTIFACQNPVKPLITNLCVDRNNSLYVAKCLADTTLKISEKVVDTVKENVPVVSNNPLEYNVIAGCFEKQDKSKAEACIIKLNSLGYNHCIINESVDYYRVIAFTSDSMKEASKVCDALVQTEEFWDAWIMRIKKAKP